MGTLTDIGTVDEAEQVENCHSGHNMQIDLQPQLAFRHRIEMDKRVAISN